MTLIENPIKLAILSSRKLNEKEIFDKHRDTLENVIKGFDPKEVEITIGNIKNKLVINFLRDLGYKVIVVSQRSGSLYNSNKKIIRENEMIVFLRYDESPRIGEFLEYAIAIGGKSTVPININSKSS